MRMLPRITMIQRAYKECGLRGLAPAVRCYYTPQTKPLTGLLKLGNYPFRGNGGLMPGEEQVALYNEYASHQFVAFSYGMIRQEDRKELIQRNPDIMIGSYVSLFHIQHWMSLAQEDSFAYK